MSYDKRVKTTKELKKAYSEIEPGKHYILEVDYQDGETGKAELPTKPSLEWLYSEIVIKNNKFNDCQASRLRLYNANMPTHALLSFSVELLEKALRAPDYNPKAPRISHDLGDQETKTKRLQILMRPSIKKELKRQSEIHGQSMSEVIDTLVSNWLHSLQTKQ